jgi:hypothetical protein
MTSKNTTSEEQTQSLVSSHASYAIGAAKVRVDLFNLAETAADLCRKLSEALLVVTSGKRVGRMTKTLQ